MKKVLGIDVGGTKILIGLVDEQGKILHSKKYQMHRETQEQSLETILQSVDSFMKDAVENNLAKPDFIGMGTVGHIDNENGIWLQSQNIPISQPVAIGEVLKGKLGIPARIDNDVHCAALGESRFGEGKDARCMVYINIGTGISSGIVYKGELIRGASNYAGEIGYMRMDCNTNDCETLEKAASGIGIISQVEDLLKYGSNSPLSNQFREKNIDPTSIFEAAKEGDALASMLTKRAVRFIGTAVCNLMVIFNPDKVVFGGGVAKSEYLCGLLNEYVEENCIEEAYKSLKFFGVSKLDADKTGLIGTAALWF